MFKHKRLLIKKLVLTIQTSSYFVFKLEKTKKKYINFLHIYELISIQLYIKYI